jgi:hypothetical protein
LLKQDKTMKRLALGLMWMLIPAALVSQAQGLNATAAQPAESNSVAMNVPTDAGNALGAMDLAVTDAEAISLPPAPVPSVPQQTAKASQAPSSERQSRPPLEGSMVGYVDNPIVDSEIRIRFDDAFDDRFPDRAEFFYSKCGCYRGLQGAIPPAFDPNAPGPGLGVPKAIDYQQLYMQAEYSPQRRFSMFAEVPVRWLSPQGFLAVPPFPAFSSQSGLSDVTAGFKFAAVASEGTYITFQFKSYFPTGDASKGLGTNHYSVEPSALVYHKFSDRWTLEGQVGDWHPIGGSAGVPTAGSQGFAGDVFFYGIGPSYKLYRGSHFAVAPVIELFGWHVLGGFQTDPGGPIDGAAANASGINIVNLKAGLRFGIGFHNSFYAGFGQALTHDDWYEHIVRVEYRYAF